MAPVPEEVGFDEGVRRSAPFSLDGEAVGSRGSVFARLLALDLGDAFEAELAAVLDASSGLTLGSGGAPGVRLLPGGLVAALTVPEIDAVSVRDAVLEMVDVLEIAVVPVMVSAPEIGATPDLPPAPALVLDLGVDV